MKYTSFLLLAVLVYSSCNNKEAGDKATPDSTSTSDSRGNADVSNISDANGMNPCSCLDAVIDMIVSLESKEEAMMLQHTISRELNCDSAWSYVDFQTYLDSNCPDTEERFYTVAESKALEFGLLE